MQQTVLFSTVFGNIVNHLVVLTHGLCPMRGGIEPVTVRAGHIGDVPNGVGTGTVLQCATGHGVCEALHRTVRTTMLARVIIACAVVGSRSKSIAGSIPHGRIQVNTGLGFAAPLLFHVLIGDGIEQSGAVKTNGSFQADFIVVGSGAYVEGCLRNGHFGVNQFESFTVGKLPFTITGRGNLVGLHLSNRLPVNLDLVLVDRSLEG